MQRWTKGYYAILIALSVKRANEKEESARYSIGFAHERVHFVAILGIFRSTHLQHELNLLFYKSLESLQRPSRDLVSVKYTIGYRSSVAQSLAFFCSFFMCRQHQTENSSTMCLYYGEWAREEVRERNEERINNQYTFSPKPINFCVPVQKQNMHIYWHYTWFVFQKFHFQKLFGEWANPHFFTTRCICGFGLDLVQHSLLHI